MHATKTTPRSDDDAAVPASRPTPSTPQLLERVGEARRAAAAGADPARRRTARRPAAPYPVIHITGTNGKTLTSRIIESLLRAHGLRTGLLTSPHLERFTERIMHRRRADLRRGRSPRNWEDIQPYLAIVDAELEAAGDAPLTFFEALTVLAFACFADAPVDVVVLEVGMGGEWDSTNVADGQVAVFAPIALDHTDRLGNTIARDRHAPRPGIIKPAAAVVSARQTPRRSPSCERAAELTESTLAVEGDAVRPRRRTTVAVGGQLVSVRGLAGRYDDVFLPLFGDHQAQNAAVAIAAVESFLGGGSQPLVDDVARGGPRRPRHRPGGCSSSASSRRCSWTPRTTRTARTRSPRRCRRTSTSTRSRRGRRRAGRQGRRGHRRARWRPLVASRPRHQIRAPNVPFRSTIWRTGSTTGSHGEP